MESNTRFNLFMFFDFLASHELIDKYRNRVFYSRGTDLEVFHKGYKYRNPVRFIICDFRWEDDSLFWYEVYNKWLIFINQVKREYKTKEEKTKYVNMIRKKHEHLIDKYLHEGIEGK